MDIETMTDDDLAMAQRAEARRLRLGAIADAEDALASGRATRELGIVGASMLQDAVDQMKSEGDGR